MTPGGKATGAALSPSTADIIPTLPEPSAGALKRGSSSRSEAQECSKGLFSSDELKKS